MSDQDATDPGMERLSDGTIVIGNASQRAQLKRQAEEAIANAQGVVDKINAETEKEGNEDYIDGSESSPGTKPEFDKA